MRLLAWLASTLILLSSCGVTAPPAAAAAPKRTMVLSWTASNAVAVNRAGGGYRVYYANSPITDLAAANVRDIPWTSGNTPSTTTFPTVADGTYYFRIVAYSSMVDPNTTATAISALSKEVSITIP